MKMATPTVPAERDALQALVQKIGATLAVLRRQPPSTTTIRQIHILVSFSVHITATVLHENTEGLPLPMAPEKARALWAVLSHSITQRSWRASRSPTQAHTIAGIQVVCDRWTSLQRPP